MVEDKWLLLASIPVVVFLGVSIRLRMRDLNKRIEQAKRETGPINPYQAMYDMMGSNVEPKEPSPLLLKAMGKASPPADVDNGTKNGKQARGQQEDNDG